MCWRRAGRNFCQMWPWCLSGRIPRVSIAWPCHGAPETDPSTLQTLAAFQSFLCDRAVAYGPPWRVESGSAQSIGTRIVAMKNRLRSNNHKVVQTLLASLVFCIAVAILIHHLAMPGLPNEPVGKGWRAADQVEEPAGGWPQGPTDFSAAAWAAARSLRAPGLFLAAVPAAAVAGGPGFRARLRARYPPSPGCCARFRCSGGRRPACRPTRWRGGFRGSARPRTSLRRGLLQKP